MTRLPPDFWAQPFAHRGLHGEGHPENSLSAIAAAVSNGYGIEIDLQPDSAGEPVVFHDATLKRLTGLAGRVDEHSVGELTQMPLGGSTHGDAIPTLVAALELIAGRVPVLIELKDQSGDFSAPHGVFEQRVCEIVAASVAPETCALMSFTPASVAACAECAPDLYRGLVSYSYSDEDAVSVERRAGLASMQDFASIGCDFASYGVSDLPNLAVDRLRKAGIPVFCWTIRSQAQADAALEHCDQITFESYAPA